MITPPLPPILHITTTTQWQQALAAGHYTGDTLASEGFIHCSRPDQVIRVANAIFRGRADLLLLVIDPSRITAEIRHENLEGSLDFFPHIYGPLNIDAVSDALPFPPDADGRFTLPEL